MGNQKRIFVWIIIAVLLFTACGNAVQRKTAGKDRDYQIYYNACPDAAYPAQEWFSADGRLDFPFSIEEPAAEASRDEMFARFYMPEEALKKAETKDLLRLVVLYPRSGLTAFFLYNYPSHYLDFVTQKFNAVDELCGRKDFAQVLLTAYAEEEMLQAVVFDDKEEQAAYEKERSACANGIMLLEILLAQDAVFEKLDDGQRLAVLEEAAAKDGVRENDACYGQCSGFFASVKEQYEAGGSKWYDYIKELGGEWTFYLDEYWETRYWH